MTLPHCLLAWPLPLDSQPGYSLFSSGREEPGCFWGGGLWVAPFLLALVLGPWFLFYQVIYPLKEIYPDSGELASLGHVLPSQLFLFILTIAFLTCAVRERPQPHCWVQVGSTSPPPTVYSLGARTLTSSCFVFPSLRRGIYWRKGRDYFLHLALPLLGL